MVVFIFQGKAIDIPKLKNKFVPDSELASKDLSREKYPPSHLTSRFVDLIKSIQVAEKVNFTDDAVFESGLTRIKVFLVRFAFKNRQKIKNLMGTNDDFDKDLVTKLKVMLIPFFQETNWSIFVGKTALGCVSSWKPDEKMLALTLDFRLDKGITYKRKILMFQKKTKYSPFMM